MPEPSAILILLIVVALVAGIVLGWVIRSRRAETEKAAINAGWSEQFDAQRSEHERLVEQNRSLMDQNSQYQASNRDSKMRAAELSAALKEAFERRDELQRQIKDIRGNLESAVAARSQLESDIAHRAAEVDVTATALKQRDLRIAQLAKELKGWQERVPPLIEKFRSRNEEATALEAELAEARERIEALEEMMGSDQTRVEPLDRAALGENFFASNEPLEAGDDDVAGAAAFADADRDEPAATATAQADAADDAGDNADDNGDVDDALPGSDGPDPGATGPAAASNGGERDNLKLIKGVGPAIEKTLNEMGIRRLEQIAAMSEYDIDRVARRLKGFRSRIYREDWMGQARDLLEERGTAGRG
ncbi:MAG: hypothetical protein R3176_01395 [Woeseiaceae bacterium]|nr:hypothetical protein [Woeseiaceae bacterium]